MFPNLNPMELMVVFGIAVLLFGKRLPEVGRSLGRGIVEFKKGIRGVEEEFRSASNSYSSSRYDAYSHDGSWKPSAPTAEPEVPKFEPPSGSPAPKPSSSAPKTGSDPDGYQD